MDMSIHTDCEISNLISKNLPFPVWDEQKSAKIASESSLLVTYQCFFIEVAEKTTLAEPSLQRPQLFIHIGGAYENCVKWLENCSERQEISRLSSEKSETTTRAWTTTSCRISLSTHHRVWQENPFRQDWSRRLRCCHWRSYLVDWWVFSWNIFWP